MADKKTQLMAKFYVTCQKQGYTDMNDPTQSLKAKVIATDMKLNYGNIVVFYDKAKQCYQELLVEKAEAQKEAERRSVDGMLLVTLCEYKSELKVYVRPDKTIYTVYDDGEKEEGAPTFSVSKGGTLDYTYRPSKAIYTSATVGGITTGGVHYTKEGYDANVKKSKSGIVTVKTKSHEMTLRIAQISDAMKEAFKRDPEYLEFAGHGGRIVCSTASSSDITSAVLGGASFYGKQSSLSHTLDANRKPYEFCVGAVNLIERIIRGQLPPSDEALYKKADSLAQSKSAESILRAAERFEVIADYKDSSARAKVLREKYEIVLQAEKETAILEKEASQKRGKRLAIILTPIVIIGIVVSIFIGIQVKQKQEEAARLAAYQSAVEFLENGYFDSAIKAFTELGDYLDSKDQISVARDKKAAKEKETLYNNALNNVEQGNYSLAMEKFQELGNYKDSQEWINKLEIPVFKESVADKKAGQIITFGSYEQDGNLENGSEPIEWIVLQAEENDLVILMSKYVLDAQPFHTERDYTTWGYSSLRIWLHNDFVEAAFTEEEVSNYLAMARFSNPDNPDDGTDCGPDTEDAIFLLNAQEARYYYEKLKSYSNTLETEATAYAQGKGIKLKTPWMLRSVNEVEAQECNAVCVCPADSMYDAGDRWEFGDTVWGVRPCILFYTGVEIE